LQGLEQMAAKEIQDVSGVKVRKIQGGARGDWFEGIFKFLSSFTLVHSAYLVVPIAGKRPSALLGDQNLKTILHAIQSVLKKGSFRAHSFRISAAGDQSSVMRRIAAAIAEGTGLREESESGELKLRIRKDEKREQWEVLVRLTPLPLATRHWRKANYRGALNANIASAMVHLAKVASDDVVVDPFCGSGTLLLEAIQRSSLTAVGVDTSPEALSCASVNMSHIPKAKGAVCFVLGDVRHLPVSTASASVVLTNPPWGESVGKKKDLANLYQLALDECVRVATPSARILICTQEQKACHAAIEILSKQNQIQLLKSFQVFTGSFHPWIFQLVRR
ncbi:MAG: RsmD family RNA methyltransferase, partial [Bdellovibrionales bacterium]|nr:RsmD family RNA methyltransferase [Bdellovibrionales bacterium]